MSGGKRRAKKKKDPEPMLCKKLNIFFSISLTYISQGHLSVLALAMKIFRSNYYAKSSLLGKTLEAQFLRKAFYGGHTDVYKPYGENLYVYDSNSLYPFSMTKKCPVVSGPMIEASTKGKNVFFEANIECPLDFNRPFLPFRLPQLKYLIFPTGNWKGTYYSKKLKYAKSLGV
uniref:hypothetical protein n=1 Tax=Marchantia paleacea TaxID=56867 RepID=UPI0000DBEC65|nr:hypothetical protein MpooMp74 [Marchantia paleacea]